MRIEILDKRHSSALKAFLGKHLHSSLFIYSNLERAGVLYDGNVYTGEYFGLISDDELTVHGILVHYWNGMLLMQCPNTEHLHWLCEYFADYCERPVAGVIGSATQAKACIESLGLSDQTFTVRRDEDLMSLSLDSMSSDCEALPETLSLQRPLPAQAELLKSWLSDYEVEAFAAELTSKQRSRIDQRVQHYLSSSDGWLLSEGDNPVAFAGFNARAAGVVQVGPVWTPPRYRNHGYARTLVAAMLRDVQKEGYSSAVLFTSNPAAHQAYRAIGFKDTGGFALAFFERPVALVAPDETC